MDDREIFSRNLNYYMKANGKTRNDLCQALDFNYYTVTDWVNGKKMPRMDKVTKLAEYFGIRRSDLIEDHKEKPTAADDGLSESVRTLIEFAKSVPEDKAEMILKVMKSIVEAD